MTERRPRVLWIHPGGLWPIAGGGASRTWALIDFLRAQGYAVELVMGDQGAVNEAIAARVDKLHVPARSNSSNAQVGFKRRLRNGLIARYKALDPERRLLAMLPGRSVVALQQRDVLSRNRRPALERFAATLAYADPPLAAIASYAWLAPVLDHLPPGTLRLLDTIDIQHARRENAAAAGGNLEHVQCSPEDEARALNRADILLAIQAEEAATLKGMCPEKEILCVEHAHPVPDYVPSPVDSQELLYVGNRYDPNVLGLEAILAQVWPEVLRQCPAATLTVCGRVGETVRRAHPGVTIAGQVPELAPYYHRAALVLNPVPYGTGLKIKTVEGMAHGRVVVCTEAGTGGLGDMAGLPLCVSEVGEAMVQQIVALLAAPSERHPREKAAWEFARERFSPERVYGPLVDRLRVHGGV